MNSNIRNNLFNSVSYHLVFINPGFPHLLEALKMQEKGFKIMIIFENDLERSDRFYFTRTFPYQTLEFPSLLKKYVILQSLIKIAPHLFQPQKVVYLGEFRRPKTNAIIADYFYKNTYQKKSNVIDFKSVDNLTILKEQKGAYFQEYKINVSRLFLELLKYFKSFGGDVCVQSPLHIENEMLYFKQSNKKIQANKIVFGKHEKTIRYAMQIKTPENFYMVIKQGKNMFRFTEASNKLIAEPVNDASKKLTKEEFLKFCENFISFENIIKKIIRDDKNPCIKELKELPSLLQKPLKCTFENAGLPEMNELCLEKYDEAKQTGINYPQFKKIFHRYGKAIDEIIESAYVIMNSEREPEKIWNAAEILFQKANEWKI